MTAAITGLASPWSGRATDISKRKTPKIWAARESAMPLASKWTRMTASLRSMMHFPNSRNEFLPAFFREDEMNTIREAPIETGLRVLSQFEAILNDFGG
jgi:hypothetical protein